MVALSTSTNGAADQDSIDASEQRKADAWAVAVADLLWSDERIRARMSAEFQKTIDHMLIARFGRTADA